MRARRRYNRRTVAESAVTPRALERKLASLARLGVIVLVSVAGGALATLVAARVEAVPMGESTVYFLREREFAKWDESSSIPYQFPHDGFFSRNGWTVHLQRNSGDRSVYAVRSWGIPEASPSSAHVPSWSRVSKPSSDDPRCLEMLEEIAYGWPMKSMVVEVIDHKPNVPHFTPYTPHYTVVAGAVPPARRANMDVLDWFAPPWFTGGLMADPRPIEEIMASFTVGRPPPMFPTRMIPVGFGVNTAFFATLIGSLLFALRVAALSTRAAFRANRGECRSCGHALAGLPRCPECGAEVPRPARA